MVQNNIKAEYLILKNKKIINKEKEIGGYPGPEPTRYGVVTPEWEHKGKVTDF